MGSPASDPLDSDLPDVSLLTVAEVVSALRVSTMTVYRLIRAGEIQSIRVGRSVRVSAASLRGFFQTRPSDRPAAPRVRVTIVKNPIVKDCIGKDSDADRPSQ